MAQVSGQTGTGLHLDCNAYNLWKTEKRSETKGERSVEVDLEWFRPFQSFVALTDASDQSGTKDGGLEIVPGFFSVCESYFRAGLENWTTGDAVPGRNLFRWGSYNTKFSKKNDEWILSQIVKAQRIPDDWNPPSSTTSSAASSSNDNNSEASSSSSSSRPIDPLQCKTQAACTRYCTSIAAEHRKLKFKPIEAGDFVLWDIRTPHQNSDSNDTDQVRSVFYHAYMVAQPSTINQARITAYAQCRLQRKHTPDFPKGWADLEENTPLVPLSTDLAKALYNQTAWSELEKSDTPAQQLIDDHGQLLTDRHIAFFKKFGYVVVEGAVSKKQATKLYRAATKFTKNKGCDLLTPNELGAKEYKKVATSFGAMVELFYLEEQQKIRLSEATYAITAKLGVNTWNTCEGTFTHPFADQNLDCRKLWLYIDRMNIRLPTGWLSEESKTKRKRASSKKVEESKKAKK